MKNTAKNNHRNRQLHLRRITFAAMMAALSVVIGIICKNFFTIGLYYRVTFENLPIIFTGLVLGPVYGAIVGISGDVISCLLSTNPNLNPIITIGAMCVGLTAGLVSRYIIQTKGLMRITVSAYTAHIIGQVFIKSIAKIVYYRMPAVGILFNLTISFCVATAEIYIIYLMMKTKAIENAMESLK